MDGHGPMRRIVSHRKSRNRDDLRRKAEDRLRHNVEEKICTTMIGSISLLEEIFGYLWGQGDSPINEFEREMDDLRVQFREGVLNLGNRQIRLARAGIDEYLRGTLD